MSTVGLRGITYGIQVPGAVYTWSDVVSWGSENHVIQMARLTDFELDVK